MIEKLENINHEIGGICSLLKAIAEALDADRYGDGVSYIGERLFDLYFQLDDVIDKMKSTQERGSNDE